MRCSCVITLCIIIYIRYYTETWRTLYKSYIYIIQHNIRNTVEGENVLQHKFYNILKKIVLSNTKLNYLGRRIHFFNFSIYFIDTENVMYGRSYLFIYSNISGINQMAIYYISISEEELPNIRSTELLLMWIRL